MVKLYTSKQDCCNCSACVNICPQHAIITEADEDGFKFPKIIRELCIECGLCNKVCAFQNRSLVEKDPLYTYVAVNKNIDVLLSSASGGVFGAIAYLVLERNGVVFGCAYNEEFEPKHISIEHQSDVKRIQGSKYVQSEINTTYSETKKYLNEGRWVLFTGTPCQIGGLNSYLGKEYENLITIDLICHGVPSAEFFKGYINYLEWRLKAKVVDLNFRDKSKGWGHLEKIIYKKNSTIKKKIIKPYSSYYHSYFLDGEILRESCYVCKYACGSRVGDFTVGDYWGIKDFHPEVPTKNGASVLLVNSNKGKLILNELVNYIDLTTSTFEYARAQNGQLSKPTVKGKRREAILKTWREGGFKKVADEFYKNNRNKILLIKVKMFVPNTIKRIIKRVMGKK
jgi:coenzyme F420-reducing hydrogenase beta subunit